MLCVKGIEYVTVPAWLARENRAVEELVERLYQIKFRSWDFLVQRYLRDGMEDEKVKELLKEQFRSRFACAGDLQLLACADGVGPFGYISPLAVAVVDDDDDDREGEWHESPAFSSYDILTGGSTNSTHDPTGNVIICPEIGVLPVIPHSGDFVCPGLFDRDRIRKLRVADAGRNLVRYALFRGWHAGAERICAYTLEETVGFHRSMGAVMVGPFRDGGPSGRRRALMHYDGSVVLEQIAELAGQQTGDDRAASSRRERAVLTAAVAEWESLEADADRVLAGGRDEDDDNPPFNPHFKRVS